jgi:hypothetical protein
MMDDQGKRWIDPASGSSGLLTLQDDEIFHMARIINCGHFRNVAMNEFMKGLLGTPFTSSTMLDFLAVWAVILVMRNTCSCHLLGCESL